MSGGEKATNETAPAQKAAPKGGRDAIVDALLRRAARWGRTAFGLAFAWKAARDPKVARYASVVLYRKNIGTSMRR